MPDNSGQSPQTPVNPQGHSQAASPAGQGQPVIPPQYDIGAFNEVGVDPQRVVAMQQKQVANGIGSTSSQQGSTPPLANGNSQAGQLESKGNEGTQVQPRQLTEKDERHFAKFVTQASQEKYELAKALVEADSEAIFKVAETDKDLAERLIKEFDFGTDSLEALLEQKSVSTAKDPQLAQKEIEDAKWKQTMEKELLEEKILRLKGEDPELEGEVEEKFREIWSDKAFAKYDEQQKVAIAKTLTGKAQTQSSADNVALAILQREQGVVSSPKGATQADKMRQVSPEFRQMQKSMGITDAMLDILPSDIEEQINQALGGYAQR